MITPGSTWITLPDPHGPDESIPMAVPDPGSREDSVRLPPGSVVIVVGKKRFNGRLWIHVLSSSGPGWLETEWWMNMGTGLPPMLERIAGEDQEGQDAI